jgi:hypothetical protein
MREMSQPLYFSYFPGGCRWWLSKAPAKEDKIAGQAERDSKHYLKTYRIHQILSNNNINRINQGYCQIHLHRICCFT